MHKISNLVNVRKIVTVHYQSLEKNYVFPREKHDFWEINYADKEDVVVGLDDRRIELKQGEILFIKPDQPHYVETGDKEPNLFIVSFLATSPAMQFFCDKKCFVPEEYRYLLQNVMSEAAGTFSLPDFDPHLNELKLRENPYLGGEQMIKNALETLFIYLMRSEHERQPEPIFFLSKVTDSKELHDEIARVLNEKIYGKFRLDDLCEELHYGKTQLCTYFRKKTGKSIYQTYLQMKTDEAKKLMRKKYGFAEIADKLCFDSVSTFAFVFKKYAGMTPSEYRDSIK